jgi:hypothetical protein
MGLLGGLIGAGCGSHGSHAQTTGVSAAPAGYRQLVDRVNGYEISVPDGWQQLDVGSQSVATAVAHMLAQNPQLASRIGTDASGLMRAGVHFLALGPDGSDVNVVIRAASALPGGLDGLLPGLRDQLTAAGGSLRSSDDESIHGTPALHLTITLQLGGRPVTSDQYYLVDSDRMFVITIRAPAATGATIVGTLRFLR